MSIRDQKLPFMFEYWPVGASAPAKTFVLPISPENYRIRHNAKVSVTQTKGGTFTDSFGKGIAQISISGTFGVMGSLKGGPGIHAEGAKKDAWSLLKEFEAEVFFDFYAQFGADTNQTQGLKAQLRFYNFTDEQFYEVILNPFTVSRNIQRRHLYQYQMEMQCIRDLLEPPQVDLEALSLLNDVTAPDSERFTLWRRALSAYTYLSTNVSDIINRMQAIEATIETITRSVNAFRQGLSDLIAAPFNLVESAIRSVDSIIDTAISIKDLPHEFIDHMRSLKRTLLQTKVNRHLFGGETKSAAPQQPTRLDTLEIVTAPLPAGLTDVEMMQSERPEETLFSPGIRESASISAVVESINSNDTIETLAARAMGDANQWRKIAFLNDLEPPFIAKTIEDGFSTAMAEGEIISVAGRKVYIKGFSPNPGSVVIIRNGDTWDAAQIEAFDTYGNYAVLSEPLENQYPPGSSITQHERKLNVLHPGDKIKIPTSTVNPNPTLGEYSDHYDRLFGADEYLDARGNHVGDNTGDIATTVGLKNLEMQLTHRLATLRGELAALGHPHYGSLLPALIGKSSTDYWLERIRFEAKATVLEDPRIRSVTSMNMEVENDKIAITAMVRTAGADGERRISLLL